MVPLGLGRGMLREEVDKIIDPDQQGAGVEAEEGTGPPGKWTAGPFGFLSLSPDLEGTQSEVVSPG